MLNAHLTFAEIVPLDICGEKRVSRITSWAASPRENKMAKVKRCKHGVVVTSCWVCHPELLKCAAWLFSPEMDAAYAAEKAAQHRLQSDSAAASHNQEPGNNPLNA